MASHVAVIASMYSTLVMLNANDPDLCRNAKEYRNNHKHRNTMEIRLHFINIKSQKYNYKHDGNKIARVHVSNL